MSLGFKQAGFRVVAAFDAEERHVHTYKRNFPRTRVHVADLSATSGQELLELAQLTDGSVDVLFGGPPCQGFSVGGKRDLGDERNSLIYDFARLVRQIRPKYFVVENVEGLMLGKTRVVVQSFVRRVRRAGYQVVDPIQVLNASNYGVPQRRRRTFILGYEDGRNPPEYPGPSPIVDGRGRKYKPTVRDAIFDLPDVDCYAELFDTDGFEGALGRPRHYARLMRGELQEPSDGLAWPRRASTVLTGCLRTRHSETTVKRFDRTPPGGFEDVSRYHRLDYEGVAPTIRAGTGIDHGKHTAPRPIHPKLPRCITVREAARLHSFPDWFQFHETRWHAFRQIGNSVPPRLGRMVASKIVSALKVDESVPL